MGETGNRNHLKIEGFGKIDGERDRPNQASAVNRWSSDSLSYP